MYSVLRKDGSGGTDDSTQCIASGTLIERQLVLDVRSYIRNFKTSLS